MYKNLTLSFLFISFFFQNHLFGFEKTTVLPKGIRSISIKNISTSVKDKYDDSKNLNPLGKPLAKDFTFDKVVAAETGVKKLLLKSFLLDKFSLDDSIGSFSADMKINLSVTAPIFSYGLSDNMTLAVAVPYYRAKVGIEMGFTPSENANTFVNLLASEEVNQVQAAKDVAYKLNNAVDELNSKLEKNGYQALKNWSGKGLGDITLAVKYKFLDQNYFKLATTNGLIVPSGKTSSPDILNDVPFGYGCWNIFSTIIIDEPINEAFFFNQYLKYTYQLPSSKETRLITEEETIEVAKESVDFKLGNKVESGVSAQLESKFGVQAGLGLVHERKLGDKYFLTNEASKKKLEKETDYISNHVAAKVGYSSLNAFKKKKFPLPLIVSVEYKKQFSSKNTISKDLMTIDFSMFF